MKKLLVILILLFIIIAAALSVFILTFDVNRYVPLLTERIEKAIDKDVRISNVSLNLWPDVSLRVNGVSIKDTDKTWEDTVLKIASIDANVKILPLIRKDIQIGHLRVRGLDMTITRDSMVDLPTSIDAGNTDNMDVGFTTVGALSFLAESMSITDSNITYIGDVGKRPVEVKLDIIGADLKNISLYGPVHIDARLSVFGRGSENIEIKALAYPELDTKHPYAKNVEVKIDLSRFNLQNALNALGKSDAALKLIGKEITGELVITSEKMYLNPKKIYDSNIYIRLSKGMTDAFRAIDKLEDIELDAELDIPDIIVRNLTGSSGGGVFLVTGSVKKIFSRQDSNFDIKLQDMDFGMLLPESKRTPGKPYFEGKLNVDMNSSSKGFTAEDSRGNLKVKGHIKIDDAVLKNLNILTVVLNKLNMFPGLLERLKTRLPARYKELLREDYTAFSPLETDFDLKDGKVFFEELSIKSDAFYLLSRNVSFDIYEKDLRVSSSDLFIPRDLSDAFIDIVDELEYLRNSQGLILIPLEVHGKFPNISVRPDLDYVIQKLAVSKGQELIESIFRDKRLEEIEGIPTELPQTETDTPQKKQEELEPAEVLIKTIFDILSSPDNK